MGGAQPVARGMYEARDQNHAISACGFAELEKVGSYLASCSAFTTPKSLPISYVIFHLH